jgi:predicted DNA-binding transcriptional regulator AlpA
MERAPVMGLAEIAARLGVSKSRVRALALEPGFPRGWRLSMGTAWLTSDVEAWIAKRFPDRAAPPA